MRLSIILSLSLLAEGGGRAIFLRWSWFTILSGRGTILCSHHEEHFVSKRLKNWVAQLRRYILKIISAHIYISLNSDLSAWSDGSRKVLVPCCRIFDWDVIQNTTKIGTGKNLRVSLKPFTGQGTGCHSRVT